MNNRAIYSIAVPLAVMGVILLMIIPVPQFLLDFLIAANIAGSVLLLFITIYIIKPLELSAYPSILLVMTLFRLSLNVATTRSILLNAEAGRIIAAFGNFVVGGNYIVGFTIFVILVIIQFVVITKGATRIAEVAARFTLDAMPGKQMAIDADLNAGMIDEGEARRRREEIRREADFYGAMDGASKFVRGDAIAGIIITVLNIVVGFIVGIAQKGMPWDVAGATYTILTVGDGLVSQMPALIISTSAGMIVTRAASESDFGSEFIKQMTGQPRALIVAAISLAFFAFMPGFPALPFLVLAAIFGSIAYTMKATVKTEALAATEAAKMKASEDASQVMTPEDERKEIGSMMQVDTLELEIGYGLIFLVDKERDGDLLSRISMIRKQIAMDVGFIMPPIRIRDNMQLKPNQYAINIKGVEAGNGELMPEYVLAMNPGTVTGEIEGIQTIEPVFNLAATWIRKEDKERAEVLGYTVVEPAAVIATHLTELIKRRADEIITRQDVNELIDNAKKQNAVVVDEIIPGKISVGNLQKILQNLLHEGISVRDMTTILETVADYIDTVKDIDILTEYVRLSLSKQFIHNYLNAGTLQAFTLDPELEQTIVSSLKQTTFGMNVSLEPGLYKRVVDSIKKQSTDKGIPPLFLVSPNVRPYYRRLIEGYFPDATVLSYNEIDPGISVQVIGMIGVQS